MNPSRFPYTSNSPFQHKIHNKLLLVILTQIHEYDRVHFGRLNPVQWYLLVIRWLGNMLASGGHRQSLSEQSLLQTDIFLSKYCWMEGPRSHTHDAGILNEVVNDASARQGWTASGKPICSIERGSID